MVQMNNRNSYYFPPQRAADNTYNSKIDFTRQNKSPLPSFNRSSFSANTLLQLVTQLLKQIQTSSTGHSSPALGNDFYPNSGFSSYLSPSSTQTARQPISSTQVFNTPVNSSQAGPAMSGQAYELNFSARPGENLSFATMLAATNDQFIAPDSTGIALFDKQGKPLEGDITSLLTVWDAGTEADQPVGKGSNQPARQGTPNTGPMDPRNYVRESSEFAGLTEQLVNASLRHNANGTFTLRIENNSGINNNNAIPLTPGIAVVHDNKASPLFNDGVMDRGLGLEALAEDGDPAALLNNLLTMSAKYSQ